MSPCWTDSPPGSYTGAKIVASRSVPGLGSTPSRPPPEKTCASSTIPLDGCGEHCSSTTVSGRPSPSTSPVAAASNRTS
jgi:hypothetical protein